MQTVLMSPFRQAAVVSTPGSVDIRAAAINDALTVIAPSSWYQADPLYWTGSNGIQFLRFTNVAIPQGATITSATLTVYTAANMAGAVANDEVRVYGEDVDNATQISSASGAVTRFTNNKTTASVDWYPWEANGPLTGIDQPVISPTIAAIVQGIVNRTGWVSGNALQFMVDDLETQNNSLAMQSGYTGGAGTYPRLEVTYS